MQGRIQDFKLRGAHLKKLHRAEGGAKNLGVFRVKNHDFTPKNRIFSNFRGARAGCAPPPPWIRPCNGQKKQGQKDKQQSTKHTHKTKDRVTRTPLKTNPATYDIKCKTIIR